jgi:Uma2 family endonuclease
MKACAPLGPTREKETAMSAAPKPYITAEEYLELDRQADIKSEYYAGEVFAMASGSPIHSLIAANVIGILHPQLLEKPCRVYSSNLRVYASEALYTYPDATVVYGEPEFSDEHGETLLNPTLLVEVLSPNTEAWDRGGKFEHYRQRESLQEYVLIAQDRAHAERFARQPDGQWLLSEVNGLDGMLPLPSIGCKLGLGQVYHKVDFPAAGGRHRQGNDSQA